MARVVPVLLAVAAFLAAGCATTVSERRMQDMREQAEFEQLKADVYRLAEQMKGLDAAQQDLYAGIEELRARSETDRQEFRTGTARLDRELQKQAAAIEAARREIVETITKRMAEIMRPSRVRPAGFETGREHTVQPGETLSEIATAYGVTVEAVVKANSLRNPDAIRAGQTLFIPE